MSFFSFCSLDSLTLSHHHQYTKPEYPGPWVEPHSQRGKELQRPEIGQFGFQTAIAVTTLEWHQPREKIKENILIVGTV